MPVVLPDGKGSVSAHCGPSLLPGSATSWVKHSQPTLRPAAAAAGSVPLLGCTVCRGQQWGWDLSLAVSGPNWTKAECPVPLLTLEERCWGALPPILTARSPKLSKAENHEGVFQVWCLTAAALLPRRVSRHESTTYFHIPLCNKTTCSFLGYNNS